MTQADRDPGATKRFPRRRVLAVLLIFAAGCGGESEPLRINDAAKARASILKKTENPKRPSGLPKR